MSGVRLLEGLLERGQLTRGFSWVCLISVLLVQCKLQQHLKPTIWLQVLSNPWSFGLAWDGYFASTAR